VRKRHVGIAAAGLRDDLTPQFRGFQNIGLVHRQEFFPSAARQFKRAQCDAADFVFRVDHGVDAGAPAALVFGHAARTAEIDVAGQLPQNQNVDALHQILFEGGGVRQFVKDQYGPQVGVKPQLFAQAQKRALGPDAVVQAFPFRSAHRAQQHGVALQGKHQAFVGKGGAARVIGASADQSLRQRQGDAAAVGDEPQDFQGFPDDFRTDSISGENGDLQILFCHAFLIFRRCASSGRRRR